MTEKPVPRWAVGLAALMIACYAPLNLWGPAFLILTWAYYRRRVPGTRHDGGHE